MVYNHSYDEGQLKLPSIKIVLQDTRETFLRFPLVLINALITASAALIIIDHEGPPKATILFKILYAGIVGIPFLLGLTLFIEKRKWNGLPRLIVQVGGVVLLIIYAITVPSAPFFAPEYHLVRLFLLIFATHAFVAVAPFSGKNELQGFWQFNQIILFRLINSLFYTVVLYAGFSIALAALEHLFGVNVPGRRYFELYVFFIFIFNTGYFLAGIPMDLDSLDASTVYPKILKIFAQYILSPLLLVYFIILYAYIIKILFAWSWPQGWVSALILGFSSIGFLSLLLLYPLRNTVENEWIRKAWRWFFYIMIPLIIMLPMAANRRISQYGLTESRAIICVLALWLACMVVYFLISKNKNIKIISASLCLFALFFSCGPWSIFVISENSQVERLKMILQRNSILVHDKITKDHKPLSHGDVGQINSIILYLHEMHGYDKIQPWFSEKLQKDSVSLGTISLEPSSIADKMGVAFDYRGFRTEESGITYATTEEVIDVKGYDAIIPNIIIDTNHAIRTFFDGNISIGSSYKLNTVTLSVLHNQRRSDSIQIKLHDFLAKLTDEYKNNDVRNMPSDKLSLAVEGENMKFRIRFKSIELRRVNGNIVPIRYVADIMYSVGVGKWAGFY